MSSSIIIITQSTDETFTSQATFWLTILLSCFTLFVNILAFILSNLFVKLLQIPAATTNFQYGT